MAVGGMGGMGGGEDGGSGVGGGGSGSVASGGGAPGFGLRSSQDLVNMVNAGPGGPGANGGVAMAPGGGADGSPFDMSDFPALGGAGGPGGPPPGVGVGAMGVAPPGMGGMGNARKSPDFQMDTEDFPALPGAAMTKGPHSGPANLGGVNHLKARAPAPGAKQPAPIPQSERYGLLGLLSVIRMTDPDLNTLALGTDLTTLGLNLNSSECLHSSFTSPWSNTPSRREPEYSLPSCYFMQPPALKGAHFAKFTLETLFYIFYAMPRDTLQVAAGQELYKRDWRYHKELKLWFTRTLTPGWNGANNGRDASAKNGQATIWYFDVNVWEPRSVPPQGMSSVTDAWERRAPPGAPPAQQGQQQQGQQQGQQQQQQQQQQQHFQQ